jgi:hypothetical protein
MSSNFPSYGYNTFGIDSFNQYTLQAFNPYSLYHYTVTIVSPNFPEAPSSEIALPEVTFGDFKLWCGSFLDVEMIDNSLHDLAVALINIAKTYIDVNLLGSDNNYAMFKRVVSYYVGHYLELHLDILKDEANKNSFVAEESKEDNKDKTIEMDIPNGSLQDFRRTKFGQLFWGVYGGLIKFAFQSDTPTWGSI